MREGVAGGDGPEAGQFGRRSAARRGGGTGKLGPVGGGGERGVRASEWSDVLILMWLSRHVGDRPEIVCRDNWSL